MEVRADLGMIFQEGALFDSLTVRENVGYKLYEETDMPLADVRPARRGSARLRRSRRAHRQDAVGAVGRAAPPRRHRARHGVQAADPALRRGDHRARSDHGDDRGRRDHQAARPRRTSARSSSRISCATRSTSRRTWPCATPTAPSASCRRRPRRSARPSSSCSSDGLIVFEGERRGAAQSTDPYLEDVPVLGRTDMPRTRSLAWSELKIGVLTIVAIAIAAVTDLRW